MIYSPPSSQYSIILLQSVADLKEKACLQTRLTPFPPQSGIDDNTACRHYGCFSFVTLMFVIALLCYANFKIGLVSVHRHVDATDSQNDHDSLPFFRLHRAQIVAISDSIYDINIVNRTKANIPFSGVASFNIFYCGFELSSPR